MGVPSAPLAGAPVIETVGGTPAIVTVKDVEVVWPWPSLAVTVIVCGGPSSVPAIDQAHAPVLVPVLVSVPLDAVRATLSASGSE